MFPFGNGRPALLTHTHTHNTQKERERRKGSTFPYTHMHIFPSWTLISKQCGAALPRQFYLNSPTSFIIPFLVSFLSFPSLSRVAKAFAADRALA